MTIASGVGTKSLIWWHQNKIQSVKLESLRTNIKMLTHFRNLYFINLFIDLGLYVVVFIYSLKCNFSKQFNAAKQYCNLVLSVYVAILYSYDTLTRVGSVGIAVCDRWPYRHAVTPVIKWEILPLTRALISWRTGTAMSSSKGGLWASGPLHVALHHCLFVYAFYSCYTEMSVSDMLCSIVKTGIA